MKNENDTSTLPAPTLIAPAEAIVFLRGNRTILRPLADRDIPILLKWINDPETRPFLAGVLPLTEGLERDWLASLDKKRDTEICLMIEADGKPIGTMALHDIRWKDRTATTGALIGEKDYRGKGYGTDAKMALLEYAFNTLGLRKIMSRVKAFNGRSLAYSLHCGYRVEGRLKRQFFDKGRYHDEILLGLFLSQWLPHWKKWKRH